MRVLVVTVVHVPLDARIHARQVRALRDAGHDVTLAAPWSTTGTPPPDGLRTVDLPRAVGRRRVRALRAAARLLRRASTSHDLVLLHDPELLLVARAAGDVPVVWDVHEDLAASLVARPWLPGPLRPFVRAAVRVVERRAEHRHHLVLAEHSYADRFDRPHPVVPNVPTVPPTAPTAGPGRAVYVGRVARARGAHELVEVGHRLRGEVVVEVVGDAEGDVEPVLAAAASRGDLVWRGYLPNDAALARVDGATAGLSLLHDMPNFRGSMPTKVLEYLAHGVPVVTTPLPLAAAVVRAADAGSVVPFGDVDAVVGALRRLHVEGDERVAAGRRGRAHVAAHHSWQVEGPRFVALLERWAVGSGGLLPTDVE